jgi:hypothetical protein
LLTALEVSNDWVSMSHLLCGGWPIATRADRTWKFRSIS